MNNFIIGILLVVIFIIFYGMMIVPYLIEGIKIHAIWQWLITTLAFVFGVYLMSLVIHLIVFLR